MVLTLSPKHIQTIQVNSRRRFQNHRLKRNKLRLRMTAHRKSLMMILTMRFLRMQSCPPTIKRHRHLAMKLKMMRKSRLQKEQRIALRHHHLITSQYPSDLQTEVLLLLPTAIQQVKVRLSINLYLLCSLSF